MSKKHISRFGDVRTKHSFEILKFETAIQTLTDCRNFRSQNREPVLPGLLRLHEHATPSHVQLNPQDDRVPRWHPHLSYDLDHLRAHILHATAE